MYPQRRNRPLVRVNQACVSNLPEDCNAVNIGTWNVRTLKEDGKVKLLLNEMLRLRIDILGISETHWNVDTPESWEENGYVIITSSRRDKVHRQGVAIIIKKEIAICLTDYNIISERIMSIEINTKTGPLTIFQIYAPDSSYDDAEIDMFYNNLQDEINKLPRKNTFMIIGDFNAIVGKHSYVNWPETAGRYSIGTRNIRGERLLQFCAINNLKIVNTLYKHKFRHLVTWISPDCKTRNQIDYILVQKKI